MGIRVVIPVFLLITLVLPSLHEAWTFNQAAIIATHALLRETDQLPIAQDAFVNLQTRNCRSRLFLSMIMQAKQQTDQRDEALSQLLYCSPEYLRLIYVLTPENSKIAQLATQIYPNIAYSWFWLAEVYSPSKPEEAIALYRKSLELNPNDGVAWCRMGYLLKDYDLQEAIAASLRCCILGDPGWSGCYHAGLFTEWQGDYATAIKYYRLSLWKDAQDHADELERQLQQVSP